MNYLLQGNATGALNAWRQQPREASDSTEWGGSGVNETRSVSTEPSTFHGYPQSIEVTLPPLGALVLAPAGA